MTRGSTSGEPVRVLNDEPTTEDRLGRRRHAATLARVVRDCDTPFVAGVFGTGGFGKTSFLRLVREELQPAPCATVWFNAWQHDQDPAPAVSMLHALAEALDVDGDFLDDRQKSQALLDQPSFAVRDVHSKKLHEHFADVVGKVLLQRVPRIVFFIDELDRCAPHTLQRVFEAIQRFFDFKGCVFLVGMDRERVEGALQDSARAAGCDDTRCLEKLVQLPFALPPLADETFAQYLSAMLPGHLASCLALLLAGLERNPRTAKRFINDLVLRHEIALAAVQHAYDPRVLALLLLFEHFGQSLFKAIAARPALLREWRQDPQLAQGQIKADRLLAALSLSYVPQFAPLGEYIALGRLGTDASVLALAEPDPAVLAAAMLAHRTWLRTAGREGQQLSLPNATLAKRQWRDAQLRDAALMGAWLTDSDLRCADLRRAQLCGAHLAGCRLGASLLRHADLREADLASADLRGADMRGADLRGANLRGADLRGAIGLSNVQLAGSVTDPTTRPPQRPLLAGRAQRMDSSAWADRRTSQN